MSALAQEYDAHLDIHEAAVGMAGTVRPDGLVPIHVIRPGIGRGKGRHLYEAKMLEEHAHIFKNWKMFVDHQSGEAKRAAGGLPRSIRDLGGIIKESWWDPNVPADPARGHGQGAVVALCRPTPLIRQLIETDPELVEASISATATAVRPIKHGGQTAWLVEGFQPSGSVDWVSMAGAGGRVAQLAEAMTDMTPEEEARVLFEAMTDAEVLGHLEKTRPDVYKAVLEAAAAEAPGETDELALAETITEEDAVKDPIELLKEALATEEGKQLVESLVESQVEATFTKIAAPKLSELVEAALEEEREIIVAEADARAERRVELRDLRDTAHAKIAEARLPEIIKDELRGRYALVEGEPTPALDVADEKDEAGKVVKPAEDKLAEAVEADIAEKRRQVAAIAPTNVRGQGAATIEGEKPDVEKAAVEEATSTGSEHYDHMLQEAGVVIDEDLYKGILN